MFRNPKLVLIRAQPYRINDDASIQAGVLPWKFQSKLLRTSPESQLQRAHVAHVVMTAEVRAARRIALV